MTSRAKTAQWIVLASLVYLIGGHVSAWPDASWIDAVTVGYLSFFGFMVYQRPRTWGFGVGLFLILLIPVQAWLWQLAVTRLTVEQRIAEGVSDSWPRFLLSELPVLAGGVCGLALRRLVLAPQKQPEA